MPRSLCPAQTTVIGEVGIGRQRQSFIWKNAPLKSERPVAHSSFMMVTYSSQYS